MGLFKKKERPVITELKCPAEDCSFTTTDTIGMKRHIDWKHPELTQSESLKKT